MGCEMGNYVTDRIAEVKAEKSIVVVISGRETRMTISQARQLRDDLNQIICCVEHNATANSSLKSFQI